jgi:ketosteroid isomerase-like protein
VRWRIEQAEEFREEVDRYTDAERVILADAYQALGRVSEVDQRLGCRSRRLSYPPGMITFVPAATWPIWWELQAMSGDVGERAAQPEELSRLVVERLNAGDVEGLVALYEPDAVLALPNGQVATGTSEIRQAYEHLVADRPTFAPGQQQPTLRSGDLALTSVRLVDGGITVEVARRQPDGMWLWAIDHPSLLG